MVIEVLLGTLWLPLAISGVMTAGGWTYLDAKARGSGKVSYLWGMAVTGFIPLVLGYLYFRSHIGDRESPTSPTERTLAVWAIGAIMAVIVAPLAAPPDPITQGWYLLGLFPVGIIVGYAIVNREQLF